MPTMTRAHAAQWLEFQPRDLSVYVPTRHYEGLLVGLGLALVVGWWL